MEISKKRKRVEETDTTITFSLGMNKNGEIWYSILLKRSLQAIHYPEVSHKTEEDISEAQLQAGNDGTLLIMKNDHIYVFVRNRKAPRPIQIFESSDSDNPELHTEEIYTFHQLSNGRIVIIDDDSIFLLEECGRIINSARYHASYTFFHLKDSTFISCNGVLVTIHDNNRIEIMCLPEDERNEDEWSNLLTDSLRFRFIEADKQQLIDNNGTVHGVFQRFMLSTRMHPFNNHFVIRKSNDYFLASLEHIDSPTKLKFVTHRSCYELIEFCHYLSGFLCYKRSRKTQSLYHFDVNGKILHRLDLSNYPQLNLIVSDNVIYLVHTHGFYVVK